MSIVVQVGGHVILDLIHQVEVHIVVSHVVSHSFTVVPGMGLVDRSLTSLRILATVDNLRTSSRASDDSLSISQFPELSLRSEVSVPSLLSVLVSE